MKSKVTLFAVITVILCLVIVCIPCLACKHENTSAEIVKEAACLSSGQKNIVCLSCEAVLQSIDIPADGHSFGDFKVIWKPKGNKKGIKMHICEACGTAEQVEFDCTHETTTPFTLQEVGCGKDGREASICDACYAIVAESIIACPPERSECSYGDWVYTKYASPFIPESGERYKECSYCGNKVTETYSMTMEDNAIYIPGTGINSRVARTSFTQSAVDNNDMIYTETAYARKDETNPFVLGHDYGTLKNLHKTQVGQEIYLYVNGRKETYRVVVSEYAVESYDEVQIIGQTTGTNIYDTFSSVVPSGFTGFGLPHEGKDLWENDNSGKTLHIYTCHKGAPCQPSHGRRGRWIVMAVQV